jgi:hypothetical protein
VNQQIVLQKRFLQRIYILLYPTTLRYLRYSTPHGRIDTSGCISLYTPRTSGRSRSSRGARRPVHCRVRGALAGMKESDDAGWRLALDEVKCAFRNACFATFCSPAASLQFSALSTSAPKPIGRHHHLANETVLHAEIVVYLYRRAPLAHCWAAGWRATPFDALHGCS